MKRSITNLGIPILFIVVLSVWYYVAADYDYGALAGTYGLRRHEEICTLVLRKDQTFTQELYRSGHPQEVQGTLWRYGEAHVSFSNEFVVLAGEEPNACGEAHGEFQKTLGIVPFLVLAPLPDGPTFHKVLFR